MSGFPRDQYGRVGGSRVARDREPVGLLANDEFRLFFHDLHGDSRVGSEEHQRVTRETGNGFRGIHVVAATIVGVALFFTRRAIFSSTSLMSWRLLSLYRFKAIFLPAPM